MLGKVKIVRQLSKCVFDVECETCGVAFQRKKATLNKLHRCPSIIDGKKYCYKCQNRFDVNFFHKDASVCGGFSKLCKECCSEKMGILKYRGNNPVVRKQSSDPIKNELEKYWRAKQTSLKHCAKQSGIFYNLPKNYLYLQFQRQNGKCYYTGMELSPTVGSINDLSISVDKLTPTLGYVENNIVLCLFCINSFKGKRTEEEFRIFLRQVIPSLNEYA